MAIAPAFRRSTEFGLPEQGTNAKTARFAGGFGLTHADHQSWLFTRSHKLSWFDKSPEFLPQVVIGINRLDRCVPHPRPDLIELDDEVDFIAALKGMHEHTPLQLEKSELPETHTERIAGFLESLGNVEEHEPPSAVPTLRMRDGKFIELIGECPPLPALGEIQGNGPLSILANVNEFAPIELPDGIGNRFIFNSPKFPLEPPEDERIPAGRTGEPQCQTAK